MTMEIVAVNESVEGYNLSWILWRIPRNHCLTLIYVNDSTEFWLIQWPINQLQPVDFNGKELSLKLRPDGRLGGFESSSRKSYDVVSFAAQEPNATVFVSSPSESKVGSQNKFGPLLDILASEQFSSSVANIWTTWIPSLNATQRNLWDLSARAFIWNIWLERNNRIFNLNCSPSHSVLFKTANMLLSWLSADSESHQQENTKASRRIKRSLSFLSTRLADHFGNTEHFMDRE